MLHLHALPSQMLRARTVLCSAKWPQITLLYSRHRVLLVATQLHKLSQSSFCRQLCWPAILRRSCRAVVFGLAQPGPRYTGKVPPGYPAGCQDLRIEKHPPLGSRSVSLLSSCLPVVATQQGQVYRFQLCGYCSVQVTVITTTYSYLP